MDSPAKGHKGISLKKGSSMGQASWKGQPKADKHTYETSQSSKSKHS